MIYATQPNVRKVSTSSRATLPMLAIAFRRVVRYGIARLTDYPVGAMWFDGESVHEPVSPV
jgi:hypothetical protein